MYYEISSNIIKVKYEIAEIGPLHLAWGKQRRKNARGKNVKVSTSFLFVDLSKFFVIKMFFYKNLYWIFILKKMCVDFWKLLSFFQNYYIKKDMKHRVWVKWVAPFEDALEKDDEYWTKWSAEPQEIFEWTDLFVIGILIS